MIREMKQNDAQDVLEIINMVLRHEMLHLKQKPLRGRSGI